MLKIINKNMDQIKLKILSILEITTLNNKFIVQELDNNLEKQKCILELEEDIKINFPVTIWSYYIKNKKDILVHRPYINLIRIVLSSCNVNYLIKNSFIKIDNKTVNITTYIINL